MAEGGEGALERQGGNFYPFSQHHATCLAQLIGWWVYSHHYKKKVDLV
jgi:hypothetical protein